MKDPKFKIPMNVIKNKVTQKQNKKEEQNINKITTKKKQRVKI